MSSMTGPGTPSNHQALAERLDVNFALQAAGLGVWEIEPFTHKVLWDERCRALVGLDKDNPLPFEEAIQYIHPDDLGRVLAAIQRAMTVGSGGYFDETYRTLGADEGKLRWVRFWGQGYFTPAGELHRFSGVAQDVSPQMRDRQQLAESEAHLQLLRDTVPAMIFYLDQEQRYQSHNEVFRDWFGIGPHEALGKTVREFLGEEAYQAAHPYLASAYGGRQARYELHAPARMEGERWLSIVYTPHRTGDGTVMGIIVHAMDITHAKQAERALREREASYRTLSDELEQQVRIRTGELALVNHELMATNEELEASLVEYAAVNDELEEANELLMRSNENLQQFAYVASHDLQEPLRKIQQFGDLLKTSQASLSGDELVYIERMQSAAKRMSTLIRDLLAFSRLATQRDMSQLVPLNEVVEEVLTTLELTLAETGAQVQVDYLPTVLGDASQLAQLFQNLLSNALKFRRTDPSGVPVTPLIHLNASIREADQLPPSVKPVRAALAYHLINVVDNGVGFEEKYLDRIFQVFQRLHGKSEFAGTGIGLAICERVVTNHGGAITARSQPGEGATFSVYLPL